MFEQILFNRQPWWQYHKFITDVPHFLNRSPACSKRSLLWGISACHIRRMTPLPPPDWRVWLARLNIDYKSGGNEEEDLLRLTPVPGQASPTIGGAFHHTWRHVRAERPECDHWRWRDVLEEGLGRRGPYPRCLIPPSDGYKWGHL